MGPRRVCSIQVSVSLLLLYQQRYELKAIGIRSALLRFLKKRISSESLHELQGPDGLAHCVFLCCDLPYQYLDEYFDKLGSEHFPKIENEVRIL